MNFSAGARPAVLSACSHRMTAFCEECEFFFLLRIIFFLGTNRSGYVYK